MGQELEAPAPARIHLSALAVAGCRSAGCAWLFIEAVVRPLVWLLAHPRVVAPGRWTAEQPMLIVANHVTSLDGPLVQYALPGAMRRRIAVAMSGEMLEDYPPLPQCRAGGRWRRVLSARPAVLLPADGAVQCVSPGPAARLPAQFCARRRGHGPRIQCAGFSRGHALGGGASGALPAGNWAAGEAIAAPVLPVAIRGLGELKTRERGLVPLRQDRSACGQPMRFAPEERGRASPRGCTPRWKGCWERQGPGTRGQWSVTAPCLVGGSGVPGLRIETWGTR